MLEALGPKLKQTHAMLLDIMQEDPDDQVFSADPDGSASPSWIDSRPTSEADTSRSESRTQAVWGGELSENPWLIQDDDPDDSSGVDGTDQGCQELEYRTAKQDSPASYANIRALSAFNGKGL